MVLNACSWIRSRTKQRKTLLSENPLENLAAFGSIRFGLSNSSLRNGLFSLIILDTYCKTKITLTRCTNPSLRYPLVARQFLLPAKLEYTRRYCSESILPRGTQQIDHPEILHTLLIASSCTHPLIPIYLDIPYPTLT